MFPLGARLQLALLQIQVFWRRVLSTAKKQRKDTPVMPLCMLPSVYLPEVKVSLASIAADLASRPTTVVDVKGVAPCFVARAAQGSAACDRCQATSCA